jgi:hypothetical protein
MIETVSTTSLDYYYASSNKAANGDIFTIKNSGNVGVGTTLTASETRKLWGEFPRYPQKGCHGGNGA